MKPGIPWSVKGVEPELREIAKTAARRSGMTLGEWLNSAINEQAEPESEGESPAASEAPRPVRKNLISTHPIERAATKLEDIAEQLARLAARETDSSYRTAPTAEEHFSFAKVLSRVETNERQSVEALSAMNDRLATLSRQISRPAAAPKLEETPGYQAMEKAVRNIVEHLEVSDRRTRENMKSLQERMAEMANKVASSNSEQVLRQAPAFNQLENRLTDLARRLEHAPPAPAQADDLRAELDQLAGRIETVHQAAESLANRAQTQAVQSAQGELRAIEQRITSLLNDARQSISTDHLGPAEASRFHDEIGKLNARIDESARNAASDRDVNALKVAVEQLSARVAQGQDPRTLADLDRRVVEISQKLERTDAATQQLPHLAELERRFSELDQRLAQTLRSPSSEGSAALAQKLTEVDERLGRTEHQMGHLETIERAISQLYDTIEQNRKSAHDIAHEAAGRVAHQVAQQPADQPELAQAPEIMALQDGLHAVREAAKHADVRNQETLEAVHETLEQIVSKLAELETAAIGQRIAAAASAPGIAQVAPAETPALVMAAPVMADPAPDMGELSAALRSDLDIGPLSHSEFLAEPHLPLEAFSLTPNNFMDSPFAEATPLSNPGPAPEENPLASAQAFVEQQKPSDGGIGDMVAAARRLHQASHGQANVLAGVKPGKTGKPAKEKTSGLSFLKFSRKERKPAAPAAAAPAPQSSTAAPSGSRTRLVAIGLLLLAVATFATTNMLGRMHAGAPATPATATEQQEAAPAPPPAATTAPEAQPAPQPEPAPIAAPDAKTGAGGQQQGDASSTLAPADPILTGTLGAAPAVPAAAPVAAAVPVAIVIEPAVGPVKLRHAAEAGDANAAFIVATHYLNGDTVGVDFAKAAYWYGKSAAAGVAPAQYRLATLYERGKGVDKNLVSALSWYERAGALGNIKAMHNAAVIAAGTEAGTPDYQRAFKWFTLAANHGVKDSQFNLAVLIERGLGTRQNSGEALFWYMAAAQQGDADAKTRVDTLSKTLAPDVVAGAKARMAAFTPQQAPDVANVVPSNDVQWNPSSAANDPPINMNDQAKTLLDRLGYRVGDKDGTLDTKTANAIKLFQMKQGLRVTGQVTPELLSTMQGQVG